MTALKSRGAATSRTMPPINAKKRTSKAKVHAQETTPEENRIGNEHDKEPSSTSFAPSQCRNTDNAGGNGSITVGSPRDEGDPIPEDDSDISLLIPDGPYAEVLRELRTRTANSYPMAMLMKLEAARRRQLNETANLQSSQRTASLSHTHKVYVVMQKRMYNNVDQKEKKIIAISANKAKANAKVMSFFQQENPKYLLRPADVITALGSIETFQHSFNSWGKPFLELWAHFDDGDSFGVGSSTWAVGETGNLVLLASREGFHEMVYVEAKEFLT
ncbi:hypothetical protein F5Y04DRAFT_293495 [Hypomontagnella monticulosa]|nr:hypothetical protein F5Y04DRAFT_293495 [Hypomontagnella monticulosa]